MVSNDSEKVLRARMSRRQAMGLAGTAAAAATVGLLTGGERYGQRPDAVVRLGRSGRLPGDLLQRGTSGRGPDGPEHG
jgi:hypothetical protein